MVLSEIEFVVAATMTPSRQIHSAEFLSNPCRHVELRPSLPYSVHNPRNPYLQFYCEEGGIAYSSKIEEMGSARLNL